MSVKRKWTVDEPPPPFVTFVVKRDDREIAFDRVFQATSLVELKAIVATKLHLPPTATINFTHLRDKDEVALEDDEDFVGFIASTSYYNHSRVRIDLPEVPPIVIGPHPPEPKASTAEVVKDVAGNAKNSKRRKKTSNTSSDLNAVEQLIESLSTSMDVDDETAVQSMTNRGQDSTGLAYQTQHDDSNFPENAAQGKKTKRTRKEDLPIPAAQTEPPLAPLVPNATRAPTNPLPEQSDNRAIKLAKPKPKSTKKLNIPGHSNSQSSPGTEDTLTENASAATPRTKLFSPEPGRSYPTPPNRAEVVLPAKRQGSRPPQSRKKVDATAGAKEKSAPTIDPKAPKPSKAMRVIHLGETDDKEDVDEPEEPKDVAEREKPKETRTKKASPRAPIPACPICREDPGHENFQCPPVLATLSGDDEAIGFIKERAAELRTSDVPEDAAILIFLDRIVSKHDADVEEPKKKPRQRKSKATPATDENEGPKAADVEDEENRGRPTTNRKSRTNDLQVPNRGRSNNPSTTRRTRSTSRPAPEPLWANNPSATSSKVKSPSVTQEDDQSVPGSPRNAHYSPRQSSSPKPTSSVEDHTNARLSTIARPIPLAEDSDDESDASSDGLIPLPNAIPTIHHSTILFHPSSPQVTSDYRPTMPSPPVPEPDLEEPATAPPFSQDLPSTTQKLRPATDLPSWRSLPDDHAAKTPKASVSHSLNVDAVESGGDLSAGTGKFLNKLVQGTSTSKTSRSNRNSVITPRQTLLGRTPVPKTPKAAPKTPANKISQSMLSRSMADMYPSLESLSQQGIGKSNGQPHRLTSSVKSAAPKNTPRNEATEDEDSSSSSEDESIPQNRRAGAGLIPKRRKSGLAAFG